jgi:hypothetical protein
VIDSYCFVLRIKGVQAEILSGAKSFLRLFASNDFAPKEFFRSTLLPQSGKQSDSSVMGIFRAFQSYQKVYPFEIF